MKYVIGLDIGIASCGWAVINLDKERIEDLGVRAFDKAEHGKEGTSPALPRREARSARRRTRRRKHRIERIHRLLSRAEIFSLDQLKQLYNEPFQIDVWDLRVEALDRKLNRDEFARVLIHLAKRRGFQSNSKSQKEEGAVLQNITENRRLMQEHGYRTVAEMMVKNDKFEQHKRNKGDYLGVVTRKDLFAEIQEIFACQRHWNNSYAATALEEEYIAIWSAQRPFATKEQIEKLIGECTFEKGEKRIPRASYTFQKFRALQEINNRLRIQEGTTERGLTPEERAQVLDLAFSKKTDKGISYAEVRKTLNLTEHARFSTLYYHSNKTLKEIEKDTLLKLTDFNKIYRVLASVSSVEELGQYTPVDYDTIAYALTVYKDDQDIRAYLINEYIDERGRVKSNLANRVYEERLIEELLMHSFSKVGHLSYKALQKILPYMEEGMTYDKACTQVGYDFTAGMETKKEPYLPMIPDISNPVVNRSLSQTRKVVNAIIKKYGSPSFIHIETAGELSKNVKERNDISKEQKGNANVNEQALEQLREWGVYNPTGLDIVKYKLWREQGGNCSYSGVYIEPSRLCEVGYVEVDHILPYSRSLDDTYNNKAVVLASENRKKGNATPFEYFGNHSERWERFQANIEENPRIKKKKRQNLLRRDFSETQEAEFKERNLNDTRYITRFLCDFVRKHLIFAEGDEKKRVYSANGRITAHLRSRWGFNKNRQEGDLHHALDAVIVAVTTDGMIQEITSYYKGREQDKQQMKKEKVYFPEPWENFRWEVEARLSENPVERLKNLNLGNYEEEEINTCKPIFVSRMPRRKVTGAVHQETVRKFVGYGENGHVISAMKTPLSKIKLDKTGEFDMYGKDGDPYTYQAIKERLLAHNNDPAKAFQEELRKPTKSGKQGPLIHSVKLLDTKNCVREVHKGKGVVYNATIIRTDVFQKKGNYYLVPIYTYDVGREELPNRAIQKNTPFSEWPVMDESYEFMFSFFPYDLIRIIHKKEISVTNHATKETTFVKELLGYYKSVDSSTGAIKMISHDNSLLEVRASAKTLVQIEKYQVDVLGNYTKVKGEKRVELATRHGNKKSKIVDEK